MNTDTKLRDDVTEALLWESSLHAADIRVATAEGVVTLTGTVPSYADKGTAERTVRSVKGVKAIAEEMTVKLQGAPGYSDTDLATAAVEAMRWNVLIPAQVQATVEDGWVTLSGNVAWAFERNAARHAVRFLRGVTGVSNDIVVEASGTPKDIKSSIEKALKRDVFINADRVHVAASGGSVTLSGTTSSWNERDRISAAAWNAPCVTAVENDVAVTW